MRRCGEAPSFATGAKNLRRSVVTGLPVLLLSWMTLWLSGGAQRQTNSAEQVLDAYLHALRAQDRELLEQIAIPSEIPFVMGYEVVVLREQKKDPMFNWDLLQAAYADAVRQFGEVQRGRIHLQETVSRENEELRKLLRRFEAGQVSGQELRKAKGKIEELESNVETLNACENEYQTHAAQLRMQQLNYRLLFAMGLGRAPDESQLSAAGVEMREAVVDLRLQSKAGIPLVKKYLVLLMRPVVQGEYGRWIVAELTDLSE